MGGTSRAKYSAPHLRVAALTFCLVSAVSLGTPKATYPQEQQLPGADLFLDFTTGLLSSDNLEALEDPSGQSTIWETDVALTFDSRTRGQNLTANLGATYETGNYADRPDFDGGVTNPFLSVAYIVENRSSLLSLNASYRERDNGFADEDAQSSIDLIIDQGIRSDSALSAALEFGRTAPFGGSVEARYRERRFFDTTDPDLTDEVRYGIGATLRFRVTPTTAITFDAAYDERDEDNFADTFEVQTSYGLGLVHETPSGISIEASLRTARDETTETIAGVRETSVEESPLLNFTITQPRPNGSLFGSLEQDLSEDGRRTNLRFGRDLELRTGSLGATIGVTRGEQDSELRTIASLDYRHELPRGALSFGVSTSVETDDDDGEVIRGDARLRWERTLTQLSSVSLQINLSASDAVDPDGTDRSQSRIELAYQRALTDEWNFNTGYRHRTARESGDDPTVENEVFANIARRFSIRP